jgi:elongation factor P--beta-lysine ligase
MSNALPPQHAISGSLRTPRTIGRRFISASSSTGSSPFSALGGRRSSTTTRCRWQRRSAADPRLAERFEVYVCGLELANAFGELIDAAEQRRRFVADQVKKQALYGDTYPIDEDFLAALDHGLPPCAGAALGFDRLVMLATGAEDIEDVLWAPVR